MTPIRNGTRGLRASLDSTCMVHWWITTMGVWQCRTCAVIGEELESGLVVAKKPRPAP